MPLADFHALREDLALELVPLADQPIDALGGAPHHPAARQVQAPEARLQHLQDAAALELAVACLPPGQRRAVRGTLQGLRQDQVAAALGVSESAVCQALKAAVVRLRSALLGPGAVDKPVRRYRNRGWQPA
jgi:RNA polymerase sigma factor (sigma-70 family)